MAIAIDAATGLENTTANPAEFSHTCTGDDLILIVGVDDVQAAGNDNVTGVTYVGVAMTKIATQTHAGDTEAGTKTLWYLVAPATGSNTVSIATVNTPTIRAAAVSYTGCKQTGIPDNQTKSDSTSTTTSYALALTPVATDCWMAMWMSDNSSTPAAGANTFARKVSGAGSGWGFFDSNGIVSGATTLTATFTSSTDQNGIAITLAPNFKIIDLSDSISTADSVAKETARSFSDSVSMVEDVDIGRLYSIDRADAVVMNDSVIKSLSRSISDSISTADNVSKMLSRTVSDSITMTDGADTELIFVRSFSDSILLIDTISRVGTFQRSIEDSISLVEDVTAKNLWERRAEPTTNWTDRTPPTTNWG